VKGAGFTGDGKRVITMSDEGTTTVWDAESGKEIDARKVYAEYVGWAAFSRDGKRVVTTSVDTPRASGMRSGNEIAVLKGHTGRVVSAEFSGDGKRLVTRTSLDDTGHIWDTESGKEIAVLIGHKNTVTSAMFSGDGKRLVTTSDDKTARLWDAKSGKEIAVLKGHTEAVFGATFTGDSTRVVTASADMTARIWDVSWATLVRGDALRERVCAEKLVGAAQEFSNEEMEDPILRGIDRTDPIARNPCLRRGSLSLDYWTRLPGDLWHSVQTFAGVN
jgi:WD domain, G-beta repeat